MMVSFFLLGGAVYLNMLPWSVRALMLAGALAPLLGVRVRSRVRRDAGAAYPYPAPDSFASSHRNAGDDDSYGGS